MKQMLWLVFLFSGLLMAQTVAYTSFEEPATGGKYTDTLGDSTDHALINNDGEASVNFTSVGGEMGFQSWYFNTLNDVGLTDGDFVGVTNFTSDVGSFTDGTQGFQLSDTDGLMRVSFDTVWVAEYGDLTVSVDYFIKSTGWETSDYFRIWALLNGTDTLDIFNTNGLDINDLGIEGAWQTATGYITGDNQYMVLNVELQSNSGSEAVYFDNIHFDMAINLDLPPVIDEVNSSALTPLSNEDFVVSAKIYDDKGLDSVRLGYVLNGMNSVFVDGVDTGSDSIFTFTIPNDKYSDQDAVIYWLEAKDNAGQYSTTDSSAFIAGMSEISLVKQVDADGTLFYKGYAARVAGVTTVGDSVFSTSSLQTYIQDATAGINVYGDGLGTVNMDEGSRYMVTGILDQYNGLAELTIDDASQVEFNAEDVVPEPIDLTIGMLLASPEAFEGLLVRIANADTVAGGGNWPAEGDNMNLTITDDGGISTITMRIDKDTDIDGSPEPVYPITLTGVVSQYDGSAPYTEGYQIFPRRMEDIESANAIDNTPVVQPLSFKLYSAYPNPFNPSTTLAFDIPADMAGERVSLAVYNVLGQQMTMLVDKPLSAGHYAMTWNGLTSRGMQAPTGVYFAILKAGGQQKTTRLLLIK